MKTINILSISGFLVAMVCTVTSGYSQDSLKHQSKGDWGRGHSSHHGKGRMEHHGNKDSYAALPGLTEDQQTKIKALKIPFEKEVMPLRNQIAEKRAHLRTLQTADKSDLAAINKTIDEMVALESKMMKLSATHREDVRKLLNDEQRLAFDSRHGHHGNRGMRD